MKLTVYRKAYNWRHATQEAKVQVLEKRGSVGFFKSYIGLSYVKEDGMDRVASYWDVANVQELVEYWMKRRGYEERPNISCIVEGPLVLSSFTTRLEQEQVVQVSGNLAFTDVPDENMKQTLVEFFVFLKVELQQPAVTVEFHGHSGVDRIGLF
jgi:hypothetical protein